MSGAEGDGGAFRAGEHVARHAKAGDTEARDGPSVGPWPWARLPLTGERSLPGPRDERLRKPRLRLNPRAMPELPNAAHEQRQRDTEPDPVAHRSASRHHRREGVGPRAFHAERNVPRGHAITLRGRTASSSAASSIATRPDSSANRLSVAPRGSSP